MKYLNETLQSLLDVPRTKARSTLFGIEVEMEEPVFTDDRGYDETWRTTIDGSLRGDSTEFVLRQPSRKADTIASLIALQKSVPRRADSPRCGVHIHVDFRNNTVAELYRFMAVYFVLENALIALCGEGRKGNLFCLSLSDAMEQWTRLNDSTSRGEFTRIFSRGERRYSAMNLDSLQTLGSVEFRALRTPRDVTEIADWIALFDTMKQSSIANFKTPVEVVESYSFNGMKWFLEHTVTPKFAELIADLPNANRLLQDGIWNFQDIAYQGKWT